MLSLKQKRDVLLNYFVEHKSIKAIAKEMSLSRNTIRFYLRTFKKQNAETLTQGDTSALMLAMNEEPKYNSINRVRTVLTDEVTELIDACLRENERVKAIDIYEILVAKGIKISYPSVNNYVRGVNFKLLQVPLNAISLFSASGIGDIGLKANGISTVVSCEYLADRVHLFKQNHPESKCFIGDIWNEQDEVINYYKSNFDTEPFIILATPPCQGMSTNGAGKISSEIRKGNRPKLDPRNRLIIPALNIIKTLRPKWVLLENVPSMQNTIILDENDNLVNITDYIRKELGDEYVGRPEVIDCADYGVPQHRKRLITILSRTDAAKVHFAANNSLLPPPTHSIKGDALTAPWRTLRDTIGGLPFLDAADEDVNVTSDKIAEVTGYHPPHRVPLLDVKKHFWVRHTPEGKGAFDNQCSNKKCKYQDNPRRILVTGADGVQRYSAIGTPTYCVKCGSLLPRPFVEEWDDTHDNEGLAKRTMKGFNSIYRRMYWDRPAPTLTQNFQNISSDNKTHPSQNRVLSLYEAAVIQTITDYKFSFIGASDSLIRDSIGESIPPRVVDVIVKHMLTIL